MVKNIKIRKFKRIEAESVYKMVQNSIDISYRDIYPLGAINYFKEYHSKKDLLLDASHGYTVIAECDGEIIGTGTLFGTNVRRVYVNPFHQYKGIGKLIVAAIERKASREMIASLDLEASLVSKRFWESCGYHIESENFIPIVNDEKLHYYRMIKIIQNRK